jgi:hypothetical protein
VSGPPLDETPLLPLDNTCPRCKERVDCDEMFDGSEVDCDCGALLVMVAYVDDTASLQLATPQPRRRWKPLPRKRQPSAAVMRAVAVERRAAELAGYRGTPYSSSENRGWQKHYANALSETGGWSEIPDATPRGPAELAGWLAREIWSES